MKRIHLFEFEDQKWFPGWLRERMTRYIVAIHRVLGSSVHLVELISRALPKSAEMRIVDLCSGSGGPMVAVAEKLRNESGFDDLELVLTDLYPSDSTFRKADIPETTKIRYLSDPVDAANVPKDLPGVRTMVCSMHHMKPEVARGILLNAQESRQPICIFEISDNSVPIWLWWLALPANVIIVLLLTPWVRPMSWQQIVFTYILPILPLLIAWDGAVSNARTYTLDDMNYLLRDIRDDNGYKWESGAMEGRGGKKLYLLGLPTGAATR